MDRRALVLILAASTAYADKKIQAMIPGFQREAQTCTTQVSGLKKVQTGATALAPTLSAEDKATLDKDLEELGQALAGVEAYCGQVTELVAFLEANKDASYKSVEKELDARDNTVRKLRKLGKKIIDNTTPITRRWIGRIAQNQVQKPDEPKVKPTSFPSGRSAALPNLGKGTWKVNGGKNHDLATYTDGPATTTVSLDWQDGDQCDALKSKFKMTALDKAVTKAEGLDIAWHLRVDRGPYSEAMCIRTGGRTAIAAISQEPAPTDKLAQLRQVGLDLARSQASAAKSP